MEPDDKVSSKAEQGILADSSFAVEQDAASPSVQPETNPIASGHNSSNIDQASSTTPPIDTTLATTAEAALIVEATQLRLRRFHSTRLCTSAASSSPAASFPITLEYARMVLGHPFKVSRCNTLQALKLRARIKCTQYNAAAIADAALMQPSSSNLTVDELAASLAVHREAQRQLLLDLLGFVEQPDPMADEAVKKRSPAIDPPLGVFVGVNIRVGHEFYANAGVRIHDHAPVVIGRHVRLGPNVSLLTEGHDTDAEERRKGDVFAAPIEIGDDVWIGAGATVLGGVKIGNGAVVGAGSLVCRDVGPHQVVVGVPAKLKRTAGHWCVQDSGASEEGEGEGEGSGVEGGPPAGGV